MAVTLVGVSSLTSPSWNLSSLQASKSPTISISNKLTIKSIGAHDKLVQTFEGDRSTRRLETVRRRSQEALLINSKTDPLATLKMIDTIQHLGIEHHFQQEINATLARLSDWDATQDLSATALQFRLLRHNGLPTCSDVFKKFMDKKGNFKESLIRDIWGMLKLYEASYLGAQGEDVLLQAMDFSRAHLHQSIPHLGPELRKLVSNALTVPRHLRMAKLEAKNYMDEYRQTRNHIPDLLELAHLDFHMVQSLHQGEFAEICRWWKKLGLVEEVGFARDRTADCFLWTLGMFPKPCHSNCRIELSKALAILHVMDDIFDTYGALDELVLFTEAIKRWDLNAMKQLPEYMKICYMALYKTIHEIAYRIQKEQGLTVAAYLKKTWIEIFEAYLEEAKWLYSGYMPTFKEYLDNGVISSASYMALVHSTFLIGDGISKETISMMMKPYPRLFSCSAEILRLWDDLGTSTEEQQRGENACSIQCHMKENNISDENEARKHIKQLIGNLWPELNGLAFTSSTSLPFSIVKASLDMARTCQVIYQHGDDQSTYTVDDYVRQLLFTPSNDY